MGTDDFQKKRKARNTSKKREERKSVLIALEDTKSARFYFQDLLKDKKLIGKVILAPHRGTNPKKVLEALITEKQKNRKLKFEKEWIVIDRDEHPISDFNGTIEIARNSGICVAFSNEAYELWLLLHFEMITAYTSRSNLTKKLKTYIPDYEKSSHDIYKFIIGKQKTAIENAEKLITKHQGDHGKLKPYEQNPLTTIHQLVLCLSTLNENDKKCDCFPLS